MQIADMINTKPSLPFFGEEPQQDEQLDASAFVEVEQQELLSWDAPQQEICSFFAEQQHLVSSFDLFIFIAFIFNYILVLA